MRKLASVVTLVVMLAGLGAQAHPAGPGGGGNALLPNGRRVTPAGDQVRVGGWPQVVALSPDGTHLAVGNTGAGPQSVSFVDTASLVTQHVFPLYSASTPPGDPFDPATVFAGMAFSPDGARLWVSGGSQNIVHAFDVTPAGLVQNRDASIQLPGVFVGPMAMSPDGAHLYVVDATRNSKGVFSIDPVTKTAAPAGLPGQRPFAVAVSQDRVYVAGMSSGDVNEFDLALNPIARTHAGERPMALALAGSDLMVADANRDELVVLDARDLSERQRISLAVVPGGFGSSPNAISVHGDRAAVTLGGANAVAILDRTGGSWSFRGMLPTGWTPEAAAMNGDGAVFVANARGEMSGVPYATTQSYGPSAILGFAGTVSRIPIPADLTDSSAQVAANNAQAQPDDVSMLSPQGPIKHVVFILRENKTFDADLGDTPGGNPAFVLFPRPNTPSLHAMADRFAVLTDFYANGEASDEGHEWATGGYVTDYVDRFWPSHGGGDTRIWGSGNDPIEYPTAGYIFDAAERAGITWRDFGEFLRKDVRGGPYRDELADNRSTEFPGWDQSVPDTERAAIWEREFTSTPMPAFTFIWLPNDHGFAVDDASNPTLQQQVADNDLATGRVVAAISRSEYWHDTAIFLTEDDPQSALDHVESHRTIGMVISPWAKKGIVDVHADTIGMVRTMEMILGLPPINSFDANARPIAEAFTTTPDYTPFDALPLGAGTPPNAAALARADAIARTADRSGPDRIDPATQLDYTYLSVLGITAEQFRRRVGAGPFAPED